MPVILFIANINSPLSSRWISQFANTAWDVHVFGDDRRVHPLLRGDNITIYSSGRTERPTGVRFKRWDYWPFTRGRGRLSGRLPTFARWMLTELEEALARIVDNVHPDLIHSMKMQNETHWTYRALQKRQTSIHPPWIYSVWGSDFYYFRQFPVHVAIMREILPQIDYLMADNPRDVVLAHELGFRGINLGVFPTGGGYPLAAMQKRMRGIASARKIIAVKGYQTPDNGNAVFALRALAKCGTKLQGYRVVIHSAIDTWASKYIDDVRAAASEVAAQCLIPVEFTPFGPPESIWDLFGISRIALGISRSDGTPNTMLEALAMGAFPIQSDTGGLETWIQSGINGLLVPPDDIDAIAEGILQAVRSDSLVDNAYRYNVDQAQHRLDRDFVRGKVMRAYETALRHGSVVPK